MGLSQLARSAFDAANPATLPLAPADYAVQRAFKRRQPPSTKRPRPMDAKAGGTGTRLISTVPSISS